MHEVFPARVLPERTGISDRAEELRAERLSSVVRDLAEHPLFARMIHFYCQ